MNRTNGACAPGRWRRDRVAELELLALLNAGENNQAAADPRAPGEPRAGQVTPTVVNTKTFPTERN